MFEGLLIKTKFMFTKPKVHCVVKRMLKDYQGALDDPDKVDVFQLNNASTLNTREGIKYMLDDYQGTLEDLDKADVFKPNNAFILIIHAYTN